MKNGISHIPILKIQTVNKYNLLILEQSTKDLTEERILLAFQALDELIPKLGVFTRIFQKVREDLFGKYSPYK